MRFLNLVLIIGLVFSTKALAETKEQGLLPKLDLEVSGSFDVYSQYIWRGLALDIDPVLQPGFSLSGHGISFSFWSSWDFDNNDSLDGDEIDYVLDYTYKFDDFSVSVGHAYYEFPGTDTFSREFYGSIGLSAIPLSPAFTFYYDYGDENQGGGDGQYLTLEVSHSFALEEDLGISLDLSGRIGYNNELFIAGEGGDVLLSAGLTIPLAESLSISPSANYSVPYGDLKDEADGNQDEEFYGGFSLAYSF